MRGHAPHLPWLTPEVVIDADVWMLSRRILSRGARRGSGIPGRRTVTAWLLAGLMLGLAWGSPGAGPAVGRLGDRPLSPAATPHSSAGVMVHAGTNNKRSTNT